MKAEMGDEDSLSTALTGVDYLMLIPPQVNLTYILKQEFSVDCTTAEFSCAARASIKCNCFLRDSRVFFKNSVPELL